MPNSSSIQSEQSFDTRTIQSTQTPSTGFTPFSCTHDDTAESYAIAGVYLQKQAKTPPLDDMPKVDVKGNAQQRVNLQSRSNHNGMAALTFTDIQCDGSYLLDRRQAIIDALLQAAQSARALMGAGDYTPLRKPIEYFLSIIDFGVTVDAVALSDTEIQERANEIMARLSRECDLFIEYNGIDLSTPPKPFTRERFAAFVFITETLEYSVKTFIGHAATHAEAERLVRVAMENNPLAEAFVIERVEVKHE